MVFMGVVHVSPSMFFFLCFFLGGGGGRGVGPGFLSFLFRFLHNTRSLQDGVSRATATLNPKPQPQTLNPKTNTKPETLARGRFS